MIKKLEGHKSAQAHVEILKDGTIQLWSYTTMVIEIKGNTLRCTGLYSMTTRKHIGWFIREYIPYIHYMDVKNALEKNGGIYQW